MRYHTTRFAIVLHAIILCWYSTAQTADGPTIGTVYEVNRGSGEIVVQTIGTAGAIQMGVRLYTRIDGRAAVMKAIFPMQTIVKCRMEAQYRKYLGNIQKGMPVYKYATGIEKDSGKTAEQPDAGTSKIVGGIVLVYIPGGNFMMGAKDSPEEIHRRYGGESKWYLTEHPRHKVTVDGFWMGRYEVTQRQYEAVTGTNPSQFKGDARRPVEQVSWYDAAAFCNTLSKKAGLRPVYAIDKTNQDQNNTNSSDHMKWSIREIPGTNGFRLPYEAEWEYAVRAGTTTRFYWGDNNDGKYCWHNGNANGTTHPVGEKHPNRFGLYDMNGNVCEWCWDWDDQYYYRNSPEFNPKGPVSGSYRTLRGGSWVYPGDALMRSATRYRNYQCFGYNHYGFRVVISGGLLKQGGKQSD